MVCVFVCIEKEMCISVTHAVCMLENMDMPMYSVCLCIRMYGGVSQCVCVCLCACVVNVIYVCASICHACVCVTCMSLSWGVYSYTCGAMYLLHGCFTFFTSASWVSEPLDINSPLDPFNSFSSPWDCPTDGFMAIPPPHTHTQGVLPDSDAGTPILDHLPLALPDVLM